MVPRRDFSFKLSCKRSGFSRGCTCKAEPFKTQQLHEIDTYSSLNTYAICHNRKGPVTRHGNQTEMA